MPFRFKMNESQESSVYNRQKEMLSIYMISKESSVSVLHSHYSLAEHLLCWFSYISIIIQFIPIRLYANFIWKFIVKRWGSMYLIIYVIVCTIITVSDPIPKCKLFGKSRSNVLKEESWNLPFLNSGIVIKKPDHHPTLGPGIWYVPPGLMGVILAFYYYHGLAV